MMILFVIQGNGSWPGQQNANPGIVQNRLLKTNKRKQTQNSSRLLLWQLEVSDRRGKLGYKQARHPISRKDRQICLYGCTRCFSNRGRHRNDLPWDIKKNLNQHPMTTYSDLRHWAGGELPGASSCPHQPEAGEQEQHPLQAFLGTTFNLDFR